MILGQKKNGEMIDKNEKVMTKIITSMIRKNKIKIH
jgi:hypothetical protein